ncbi:cell envelope integrity protein TolA [Massilia sp. W12]|uniref:cell envelope integrity protein TolA n=1 Tax=Massilia sp. W12 TaxID=3126507 RepID=UPI0030D2DDEC
MSSSAIPYQIPRAPGGIPAWLLSLLVHGALLAFFIIGINWKNEVPLAIEAEVWDVKPELAAPKPVVTEVEAPPPPKPPAKPAPIEKEEQPDIVLEQQKKLAQKRAQEEKEKLALAAREKREQETKLKEEKARQEAADKAQQDKLRKEEEKKKLAEKKKQEAAEQARLDKLREAEMRRITGAAPDVSGSGGTGRAAKSTSPRGDPSYLGAVISKIRSNLIYPVDPNSPGNPHAIYLIMQLPTGEVASFKKLKSSGIAAYDLAIENAINKSSPLPRRKDGSVERELEIKFNMKE